jgi:cardiolipin synthase C
MLHAPLLLALTALAVRPGLADIPAELGDLLKTQASQAELAEITKSPETLNRVELRHLGMRSREARNRILRSAESYVFMAVPYWFDDETGKEALGILAERRAARPELDLKVMMDWSSPVSVGDPFEKGIAKRVRKTARGQLKLWNRPWAQRTHSFDLLKDRMHEKLIVVDGRFLLMGGMNIGDEYLHGGMTAEGWHDTDLLVEGPAAQEAAKYFAKAYELNLWFESPRSYPTDHQTRTRALQNLFYGDEPEVSWLMMDPLYGTEGHSKPRIRMTATIPVAKYRSPKYLPTLDCAECASPVRLVYDAPTTDLTLKGDPYYHSKAKLKPGRHFSKAMTAFRYLAERARRSIKLFIPYLTPNESFIADLKGAASRGLEVSILTNSKDTNDLGELPWIAGVGHYRGLLEAGVAVYEWQGHAPLEALARSHGCEVEPGTWPGQTIHTKAAIFDDQVLFMGSHNFNERSQNYNKELMAIVNDPAVAAEMTRVWSADLDGSAWPELGCAGEPKARPAPVERITIETLDTRYKDFEKRAKGLNRSQQFF